MLSIGIVGHRPNRLPDSALASIEAQTRSVLRMLRETMEIARGRHAEMFAEEPARLRLISSLAEGADRVAAESALAEGYSLTCILPFAVEEYERDFADAASKQQYRALLDQSEALLVLPGIRPRVPQAYETAGRTLLDNVDMLLAIWDGRASAGRGGTTELIEEAVRKEVPVIRIDASGDAPPRIHSGVGGVCLLGGLGFDEMPPSPLPEALELLVDLLVRPPQQERTKLTAYLTETWRPGRSAAVRLVVPVMQGVIGIRRPRWHDLRLDGPCKSAERLIVGGCGEIKRTSAYAVAYGWADALGTYYAQTFRGAYISNFILAALAVLMAVGSLVGAEVMHWEKWPFVVVEVVLIFAIIAITAVGRTRNWHSRWLEGREIAERLRAAHLLWAVGVRGAHAPSREDTWMGWYVRAQTRALGLRGASFDATSLADVRRILCAAIEQQREYHAGNAQLMRRVEQHLESLGMALFAMTLVVAAGYLIASAASIPMTHTWTYWVTALTAGLPALAAATYGIRQVGDFSGGERRSRRTEKALRGIQEALDRSCELHHLRRCAAAASAAMLGDVDHWKVTSETRDLALPG